MTNKESDRRREPRSDAGHAADANKSSGAYDFARQRFNSPDRPDRAWLEWFRDEYSRQLYKLDIEPNPDAPFKMKATTRMLPDLAISHSIRSPMRTFHRGDVNDDVSMQLLLAGEVALQVGGKPYELKPGMGGIGRHGTSATIEVPADARLLSIRLRRRLLEPLTGNLSKLGGFAVIRDTQAMRLLLGYIRMIETEERIAGQETRDVIATHVHDLVALAFGASQDAQALIEGRGIRAGRLAAVKVDILDNLASARLSVITVAARQGVTPRYVQMLFEAEGLTFSEFVLEQRLIKARKMLGERRFAGHLVQAIALQAGFGDLSYFNRCFRRRFGMTPSDARKLQEPDR